MYITQEFVHPKIYVDKIIVFFFLDYLFFHVYFSHWIFFSFHSSVLYPPFILSLFRLVFSIFCLFYFQSSLSFLSFSIIFSHLLSSLYSDISISHFLSSFYSLCSISSFSPPYPNIFQL